MLGFAVRAKVVRPIGSKAPDGSVYSFNFGQIYNYPKGEIAVILGIDHPVKNFDGLIVGKLQSTVEEDKHYWILAPKSRKYIINIDIMEALDLKNNFKDYELTCYYEHSAGAVTYTFIKGVPHFLLIKNKNSVNWGFPKGHMEKGETKLQTARREVFEETGVKIRLHDGFERSSAYTANHTVKKLVSFFVGFSQNDRVVLQTEELSDYIWLPYTEAKHALTFRNDRKVLAHARQFLIAEGIIEVLEDEHSLRKVEKGHGRKKKKVAAPPPATPNETAEIEAEKPADTAEAAEEIKAASPEVEAIETAAAAESTEAQETATAEAETEVIETVQIETEATETVQSETAEKTAEEASETEKSETEAETAEAETAPEAEKTDEATESPDTDSTDETTDSAGETADSAEEETETETEAESAPEVSKDTAPDKAEDAAENTEKEEANHDNNADTQGAD